MLEMCYLGAQRVTARSILGSGPIYLDELLCAEHDQALQDCNRGANTRTFGLTTCDHSSDVWIECLG